MATINDKLATVLKCKSFVLAKQKNICNNVNLTWSVGVINPRPSLNILRDKIRGGGVRLIKYFNRASQNIYVDPSAESKHGMLQQNIFPSAERSISPILGAVPASRTSALCQQRRDDCTRWGGVDQGRGEADTTVGPSSRQDSAPHPTPQRQYCYHTAKPLCWYPLPWSPRPVWHWNPPPWPHPEPLQPSSSWSRSKPQQKLVLTRLV